MGQVAPIGRGALLSQLEAVLSGSAARVTLVGEPGIGKTTLLRSAVTGMASPCRVVSVTAFESERLVSLTVLTDLVKALSDVETELTPGARAQLDLLTNPLGDDSIVVDQRLMGTAVAALFQQAPRDRPLLIAVDDFQWVDEASYQLLAYALRRTGDVDVRAIVAQRPQAERVLPGSVEIPVGPVDAGALRGMVASQLARILSVDVSAALHDVSGGNPLYAMETVRTLPPHPTVADVRLPPPLTDMIRDRVHRLPAECRVSLLDVAVRGRASLRDLPDQAGMDPAFEARIVQRRGALVEFTHPLLRRGVLESSSPSELRRAHQAAAQAAVDPITRALHIAATEPQDNAWAASDLEKASDAAYRVGDGPAARLLAQAAVDATPEGELTWSRLAMLVRCLATSAPVEDGLVQRLLDLAASPDEIACTWLTALEGGQAPLPVWLDYAQRAVAVEGTSPGISLQTAASLTSAMLFIGRPYSEMLSVLDEALNAARLAWTARGVEYDDLSDSDALGLAAALVSRSLFARIAGRPADPTDLDLAQRLERRHAFAPDDEDAVSVRGLIAMWDDRHDEARRCLDPARRRLAGLGDGVAFHLAELECRLGDFDAARELIGPPFDPLLQNSEHFVLALAAAWQADEAGCVESVAQGKRFSEEAGDAMYPLALDTALALLDLGLGRLETARDLAVRTADALDARGWNEPSIFPVLPVAIESTALTGRTEEAARLLRRLEQQAQVQNSRWAEAAAMRGRALLLGSQGEAREGVPLAAASVEAFDELGLPTEAGRSALAAGQLARRAGERTVARTLLLRAIELLEPRGCMGFVAQARSELDRIGGRHATEGSLTDAEYRVAELAAAGRTNPEIAAAEYLSVKTVEAHLSKVYRKLGVRSRAELAARWGK